MRYIRTKDGIFELANEITITEFQVIDHLHNRAFLKDEILAQADTIEELCDRFIFEYKKFDEDGKFIDRYWREYMFKHLAQETYNNCKVKDKVVYGGIITDKGLIYVAKLNSKGELELI